MYLSAAGHPPFYYILCAPFFWLFTPFGLTGQVFILRIIGVLMAMGIIWLTYKTAELIFPKDTFLQIAAAAIVGLQPMFLYITAGVNNDALNNLVFAAVIYILTLILMKGFNTKRAVYTGLLLGLGMATKGSFIIMVPISIFVMLLQTFIGKKFVKGFKDFGIALAAMAASGFWLFFWNYKVVGNVVINAAGGNAPGWSKNAPGWTDLLSTKFLHEFFMDRIGPQLWGTFGWLSLSMDKRIYQVIDVLCVVAVIGIVILLVRAFLRRKLTVPMALSLLMLAGTVGVMLVAVLRFDLLTQGGSQGRYLFAVWLPVSLFLAMGVRGLTPDKLRKVFLPAVAASLFLYNFLAIFHYIFPYFYLS